LHGGGNINAAKLGTKRGIPSNKDNGASKSEPTRINFPVMQLIYTFIGRQAGVSKRAVSAVGPNSHSASARRWADLDVPSSK
jgi:hypothetical protein